MGKYHSGNDDCKDTTKCFNCLKAGCPNRYRGEGPEPKHFMGKDNCKDTTKCVLCLRGYCSHRQSQIHTPAVPPEKPKYFKCILCMKDPCVCQHGTPPTPAVPAEKTQVQKALELIGSEKKKVEDEIKTLKTPPHITQDIRCRIMSVPMTVILEHVMVMLSKDVLPNNTKILSTSTDTTTNSLLVKITHPSFDKVLVGDTTPIYRIKKQ